MGKKRGKDKNSREEEDTDAIGRVFFILSSVFWAYDNDLVKFTVLCSSQVHHADTLEREQTKLFSRNSLKIQIGQVARIARTKKMKKKSTPVCNRAVKKTRNRGAYGCA